MSNLVTDGKSTAPSCSVVIVGAGPAGIGVALALKRSGVEDFVILDARVPGAAFTAWPQTMRMITPSFYSNPFGLTDLNAIDPDSSPADFLRVGHPSGQEYAHYLNALVELHQLPVRAGIKVTELRTDKDGFQLQTTAGSLSAKMVVWAAGQFFYPKQLDFTGSEVCLHSSKISDWSALEGEDFTIIGGYESGIDAAVNLCELGKNVRLLSRGEPWQVDAADPSRSLSPRTLDRIRNILKNRKRHGELEFIRNADIRKVEKEAHWWVLYDQDDLPMVSRTRPILANGYAGSLGLVAEHFERVDGNFVFSESCDESTITPGIFYSGPELTHRSSMFCFIYKFRSRFGLIAREIAARLGIPDAEEQLSTYRAAGFMNEDLDCCTSCQCALETAAETIADPVDYKEQAQRAMAEI
ncbi:MAG: NAD(P)-binding domain-containing protein [Akkermansiaceae bacterium]|nr:NAD(P)-binding domain-containing protein [Akkermansiaceae bacterium]